MKSSKSLLRCLLTLLFLTAAVSAGWAQDAAASPPPEEAHSLINTIIHGNPLIILIWICILGTSVTMVTFIIQLFLNVRD